MPNKIPPKQTCDKRKRKQMWKGRGTTSAKGGHVRETTGRGRGHRAKVTTWHGQ